MTERHPLLTSFPLVTVIPVLWGDLDAFGHVNNVTYLRWAETARVDYLVRIAQFPELPPKDIAPILASIKCDYRRVLQHPDTALVGTRVARIGNSSFQMLHRIVSQQMGEIAAEVDSTLVLLDYRTHEPVRIPEETRRRIAELEGAEVEA
jgi:acyl-CoA thioester hydrolase